MIRFSKYNKMGAFAILGLLFLVIPGSSLLLLTLGHINKNRMKSYGKV